MTRTSIASPTPTTKRTRAKSVKPAPRPASEFLAECMARAGWQHIIRPVNDKCAAISDAFDDDQRSRNVDDYASSIDVLRQVREAMEARGTVVNGTFVRDSVGDALSEVAAAMWAMWPQYIEIHRAEFGSLYRRAYAGPSTADLETFTEADVRAYMVGPPADPSLAPGWAKQMAYAEAEKSAFNRAHSDAEVMAYAEAERKRAEVSKKRTPLRKYQVFQVEGAWLCVKWDGQTNIYGEPVERKAPYSFESPAQLEIWDLEAVIRNECIGAGMYCDD